MSAAARGRLRNIKQVRVNVERSTWAVRQGTRMSDVALASSTSSASTLATDEAAAKAADAASTKATAQLNLDEQLKVLASIVKADQATVKADQAAADTADAKVQFDESAAGVNITA